MNISRTKTAEKVTYCIAIYGLVLNS